MKRVFLAINIPESLKEKIFETFSKKIPKKLKIVKKENLHLTLKFLGEKNHEEITQILGQLSFLNQKKIKISFKKIGNFKTNVLWLGVEKGKTDLKKLNEKINILLKNKNERFSGHLTLARNKFFNGKKFYLLVDELNKIEFNESFSAEKIDLMESKLKNSGPGYSVIKSLKLL